MPEEAYNIHITPPPIFALYRCTLLKECIIIINLFLNVGLHTIVIIVFFLLPPNSDRTVTVAQRIFPESERQRRVKTSGRPWEYYGYSDIDQLDFPEFSPGELRIDTLQCMVCPVIAITYTQKCIPLLLRGSSCHSLYADQHFLYRYID